MDGAAERETTRRIYAGIVLSAAKVSAGERTFTVADVPGLIPGASQGRGLGLDFLRHIERCAVLVHVVDCATEEPGRDPVSDIDALEAELAAYTPTLQGDSALGDLVERPRAVVLNKIDVPAARELGQADRGEGLASHAAETTSPSPDPVCRG